MEDMSNGFKTVCVVCRENRLACHDLCVDSRSRSVRWDIVGSHSGGRFVLLRSPGGRTAE